MFYPVLPTRLALALALSAGAADGERRPVPVGVRADANVGTRLPDLSDGRGLRSGGAVSVVHLVWELASMSKTVFVLVALFGMFWHLSGEAQASPLAAGRESQEGERGLFWNLGQHAADSFLGWTSLAHVGAFGSTWLLVEADVDAEVQRWAARQDRAIFTALAMPGLAGGMLMPVAVPAAIYLAGEDERSYRLAAAATQAVALAFLTVNFLKAVTGRTPPDGDSSIDVEERSRAFRPGFLRGGLWDGWPSGHSINNMALAAALASYYDDEFWVQVAAYGWAAYVMTSVVIGAQGRVHWLSDAIAGGAMGWAIGWTVGSDFRSAAGKTRGAKDDSLTIRAVPLVSGRTIGILAVARAGL